MTEKVKTQQQSGQSMGHQPIESPRTTAQQLVQKAQGSPWSESQLTEFTNAYREESKKVVAGGQGRAADISEPATQD